MAVKENFQNLFPDERGKGETLLRQCQSVMLRMLKIFDYLCNKHQIEYFLTGGSLLGAVRHNGFIPWDDDLDVGMTRKNYEKFLQFAVPELPRDIFFQNRQTDIHYPACHLVDAKLRDRYSCYIRTNEDILKHKIKWHNGLQLDIFVYDKAFFPNNFLIFAQNRIFRSLKISKRDDVRVRILKLISNYIPLPLVYASNFIYDKERMKLGTYKTKKELSKLERIRFEDMEVSIPFGWHTYLKRQYGNYMQLPALADRMSHHGEEVPDPFTPCKHTESLNWKDIKIL